LVFLQLSHGVKGVLVFLQFKKKGWHMQGGGAHDLWTTLTAFPGGHW